MSISPAIFIFVFYLPIYHRPAEPPEFMQVDKVVVDRWQMVDK
jgi:hypothetical protein